jgi:peptidoglycan/xylan/chitin deacetylase (PgdA/CDA1 family)
MVRKFINALSFIHNRIPTHRFIHATGRQVLLPFYHTVSDVKLPHIQHLYDVRNSTRFASDIDFFCQHYQPISIDDLNSIVTSGKQPSKPVFHITFDDGLSEFFSVVAPILESKGITATVFVNTDFIDNAGLFYRYKISLLVERIQSGISKSSVKAVADYLGLRIPEIPELVKHLLTLTYNGQGHIDAVANLLEVDFDEFLRKHQPYLSQAQISDLINRGFTIGSHSLDHPWFKNLSFEEQKRQISESFKVLISQFGIEKKYFSFPFSDEGIGQNLFNWLTDEMKCDLSFGISGFKDDYSSTHLHRLPMEESPQLAQSIIHSEYIYCMLKDLLNKNQIVRR